VQRVAQSFSWPFRGNWRPAWAVGVLAVLLLPIAFIPVLGYAMAATRAAVARPQDGPPSWRPSGRLVADGIWTTLVLVLLTAPFVLLINPFADVIDRSAILHVSDRAQSQFYSHIVAGFTLALPWGLLLLLLLPHATRRFAVSGDPRDLFNFAAALRGVRTDFPTWNVAAAAMVTGWIIGVACAGLLCVGLLPGIFYAILVSAHASASLDASVEDPSSR
jgi:hypothetical protein